MNELKALSAKIDQVHSAMEKQVNIKIDSLREHMDKLIKDSQEKMKMDLEKTAKELRENLDLEVGIMSSRMESIEAKLANKSFKPSFDPSVSLVITGLQQEDNEDLMFKVMDLLRDGLGCDPAPTPAAVERIRARGTKPGLVKVELSSVEEKVAVLRRKANLKDNERFQRVFVSSAKSHAERLVELNFRTFLRETAAGKDFYVTSNGRLVKRTAEQSRRSGV